MVSKRVMIFAWRIRVMLKNCISLPIIQETCFKEKTIHGHKKTINHFSALIDRVKRLNYSSHNESNDPTNCVEFFCERSSMSQSLSLALPNVPFNLVSGGLPRPSKKRQLYQWKRDETIRNVARCLVPTPQQSSFKRWWSTPSCLVSHQRGTQLNRSVTRLHIKWSLKFVCDLIRCLVCAVQEFVLQGFWGGLFLPVLGIKGATQNSDDKYITCFIF